jgi:hypothetical protein
MNISKEIIAEIEAVSASQPERDDFMSRLMKLDPTRYKVRIVTVPLSRSQQEFLNAFKKKEQ